MLPGQLRPHAFQANYGESSRMGRSDVVEANWTFLFRAQRVRPHQQCNFRPQGRSKGRIQPAAKSHAVRGLDFGAASPVVQSDILGNLFAGERLYIPGSSRHPVAGARLWRIASSDVVAVRHPQRSDGIGMVYQDSDGPIS